MAIQGQNTSSEIMETVLTCVFIQNPQIFMFSMDTRQVFISYTFVEHDYIKEFRTPLGSVGSWSCIYCQCYAFSVLITHVRNTLYHTT